MQEVRRSPFRNSHRFSTRIATFVTLALAGAALSGAGCATTAPSAPRPLATVPSGVDLVGTKWRLPMSEGGLDGRIIEFKYGENHRYHGLLTKVGRQLEMKVGAREGLVLMELVPSGQPGSFEGFERVPGRSENNDIACSVAADGNEMKCNTESTPWQRL